jgi:hypothetical protein
MELLGSVAAAMLFGATSLAQTTNAVLSGTSQPVGIALSLLPGETVGHDQVIRALLRSGTNEFIFVVPDGLRAQPAAEGNIVVTSRDMTYSVSLRLIEPAPNRAGLPEALARYVERQYPDRSALESFTTSVADRKGTGVQLRQVLNGLNPRLVRVVWVPFRSGLMEFVLNTDNACASAGQAALDMVLLTFHSNEEGKLRIIPRSDKT